MSSLSKRNRNLLNMMTDPFEMLLETPASMLKPTPLIMKTDIKETGKGYELSIELPGCNKEDISLEVKEGYLMVSASKQNETEEKDEKGTFIRKERFSGKSSRSFYVGEDIVEEDIKAKFENGVLVIDVPKKSEQVKEAEKKIISID